MNKKFILFLLLLLIFVFYSLHFNTIIKSNFIKLQTTLSSFYIDSLKYISSNIDIYFANKNTIIKLQKENKNLIQYKTLYDIAKNSIKAINTTFEIPYQTKNTLIKTTVLQYVTFGETSKVILNTKYENNNSIQSLVSLKGYASGIVLNKYPNKIAYLNNDPKCNYTVFIGNTQAPAITSGMTVNGELILKHIPLWKKITIGDMVITSGMDGIFPYGIKVGIVQKKIKNKITQTAFIKPFATTLGKRYFFIINNL